MMTLRSLSKAVQIWSNKLKNKKTPKQQIIDFCKRLMNKTKQLEIDKSSDFSMLKSPAESMLEIKYDQKQNKNMDKKK